jgi:leucyl aminopeptidase
VSLPTQVSPPEFAFSDVAPSRVVGVGTVAVPVQPDEDGLALGPGGVELLEDLGIDGFDFLENSRATGRAGEVTALPVLSTASLVNPAMTMVLFVGVGDGTPADLRRAGAALARHTKGHRSVASSLAAVGDDESLIAFVEGMVLGSFGFHWRSQGPRELPVIRVVLASVNQPDQPLLARALALAGAGWRARMLASVPSNLKTPQWLAEQAVSTAQQAGLEVKVWDEHELAKDGFGGILAVGRGSSSPPRLVRLSYVPKKVNKRTPHIALVGKGITFDTGGLSIKPGQAMVNMKRDMTGGAVVIAVLGALADLDCPIRVTGLIPMAENSIGGDAMRPGDVITHYGGRTTEVTNTDAEGRLVLADALAYAAAKLAPDALVDVATLTGGIKVALGLQIGGMFSTDDALAASVDRAGAAAGEPLWRMPLPEEYEDKLTSKIADSDNAPGGPPAVTAALFLQHFTGGLPWVHLDIASVGDSLTESYEWTAGPTGFGARLLLRWLGSAEPLAGMGVAR